MDPRLSELLFRLETAGYSLEQRGDRYEILIPGWDAYLPRFQIESLKRLFWERAELSYEKGRAIVRSRYWTPFHILLHTLIALWFAVTHESWTIFIFANLLPAALGAWEMKKLRGLTEAPRA